VFISPSFETLEIPFERKALISFTTLVEKLKSVSY
jgi:hypothetical protein